jgi:hypothetical protein
MPAYNAVAFLFDLFISIGIVLLVYKLIGKSLRELLDKVIRMPEGTAFYMRALVLIFLCVVLSKIITGVHQKPDAHFMEYVWAVAGDISGVFENLFATLLVYVGVVTVLVVVLRPKNER